MSQDIRYGSRWPIYAGLWDVAKINPSRLKEVASVAKRLVSNKDRYQAIEKKTDVPWWVIAALHERESGARFDRQMAQGDPLNQRSHNKPFSGPFKTFEDSAVWALHHDHLDTVVDWRIEKALFLAEGYNGWGYINKIPSPYLWGGTSVQKRGKYVRDGEWNPNIMDGQLGVVAMWKEMAAIDSSIKFVRETPPGTPGDEGHPVGMPTLTNKIPDMPLAEKKTMWERLISLFKK